ncbi:hypothetical protein [Limimaricola hongkongensis]|uniref:Uncharacterized protein n=1 Tax=Limimaricola hongkongensis DSM 17492 TaxID=1122180 RepID=A0A017HAG7_9RHOB|nr:hypothetical protein [Limimaricola hongkongensis]EYD71310.1 hypothetical protein Lokhon_02958 [Limimaricola hongkongensis DSM 17492]
MRFALTLSVALWLPALPVQAGEQHCTATVNGRETVVTYDDAIDFQTELGTRETLSRWPRAVWNKAWGSPPACDSRVLFTYLSVELPPEDTEGYCLQSDPDDEGWLLVPGERGDTAQCSVTTCDRVNAATDSAIDTGAALAGLLLTPPPTPAEAVAAPERLLHSSGALVLKGTAEWLATSIGTAAPGVTAALTGPVAIGAAAASVVVVGSAVYVCSG